MKPLVVLVHGFPGNATDFEPLERLLQNAGVEVVRPDLLGFGARRRRGASFEALWVDAQVEQLSQLVSRPALVFGHDFGVPCAAVLAHRHPHLVTGLVLASGNLVADPPLAPPMRALGVPLLGALMEALLFSRPANRWMARTGLGERRPAVNDDAELEAIRTIFATALKDLPRWFGPVEEASRALTVPRHFLWGEKDPFFPVPFVETMVSRLEGATLEVLPGVGHFPQLEATAQVAEAVLRRLD